MSEENKTTESQTEKETLTENEADASQTNESCECQKESSEEATTESTEEKEVTPEERIAELENEVADLKDQLLRRAADFDNYRKRMLKEKQETFDYANAALLGDLLESLDNFDRTIDAAKDATELADYPAPSARRQAASDRGCMWAAGARGFHPRSAAYTAVRSQTPRFGAESSPYNGGYTPRQTA